MPKIPLTLNTYSARIKNRRKGIIMIQFQNPILNNTMKHLDFATSMRINEKYITMQKYASEKDIPKIEKLIAAYHTQSIIEGNNVIDILTNNPHFISKIGEMTEEQIDTYIFLCSKAMLGVLINNKRLLKRYSTEDHIRICEIHLAYQEHPLIASIVDLAAKHKAKVSYIEKVITIVMNPKNRSEWDNYLDEVLTNERFYNIKSDFERLIVLNHLANTENSYEKSLYKHFATSESFVANNDIYYLIDLVNKLIALNDEFLSSSLVIEIDSKPEITNIYTPSQLVTIIKYIKDIPHAQSFFFNEFVQANFSGDKIMQIYSLADDETYQDIEMLISHLEDIKQKKLPLISTLERIYKYNLDKEEAKEVTLGYKISRDGQQIGA